MPKVTINSRRARSTPRSVQLPNQLRLFLVHKAALRTHSSQSEDTLFGAIRKDVQNICNERRKEENRGIKPFSFRVGEGESSKSLHLR